MVKKERGPSIVEKVEAVPGDVSVPDLGMTTKDREKIKSEAEIIFHCAATVRFDETLKKAVLLNVRGTKLMLDLAKECKKLLVRIKCYCFQISEFISICSILGICSCFHIILSFKRESVA